MNVQLSWQLKLGDKAMRTGAWALLILFNQGEKTKLMQNRSHFNDEFHSMNLATTSQGFQNQVLQLFSAYNDIL